MMSNPISLIFGTEGLVYAVAVPLGVLQLLAIILIASIIQNGTNPKGVVQASYCYLMMAVGIILMTVAAIPTVASVIAGLSYAGGTYVGLLILFAGGGCLYLWHDQWVSSIDRASKAVPQLLYFYTIKTIGVLAAVMSGLSLMLSLVFGSSSSEGWWVMPLTIFLFGALIGWLTRIEHNGPVLFQSSVASPRHAPVVVRKAAPRAAAKKKAVTAKKATKKRTTKKK